MDRQSVKKCLVALCAAMLAAGTLHAQDPLLFGMEVPAPAITRLPPVETLAPALPPPLDGAVLPLPPPPESAEQFLPHAPAEPVPVPELDDKTATETAEKPWKGSFELGLDGTQGNSEVFNFRFGVEAKRKTEADTLDLDLDYHKTTNRDQETANRAFFEWRDERRFEHGPWTYFVHGTVDYDEFQVYDSRVTADLGLGRELIETPRTSFAGRLGTGFSHEIGGPDDAYVPEAVFGLDFEHKFADRHKVSASTEYTPEMTAMNDFRMRSRASWEMGIDRSNHFSLKLSVLNRYDSTPNGAQPNDLDYAAVLLWKF